MAIWIDALAPRSGPLLQAASLFTANHGLEPDPPRGVSGLGELSRLIRRARRHVQDDEEARVFLEGAGAYLALLLLDHFRDASHTSHAGAHRLRLGECGTFDPFAAVAHALDAEDIQRTLLEQLRLAEHEAQGVSPTARVVAEVRRALRERPGVRIGEHFDRKLWIELEGTRIELDLGRIVEVTRDESDSILRSAVEKLCASLHGEARSSQLPWQAVRSIIFPRLVGPSFVEALPAETADLHLQRLGSEVWETLVLKTRERARYVRRAEVTDWSKDGAAPRAQALQNLARASERARFLQHDTRHGPIVMGASRDGLDAARLLLPGLHSLLAGPLGTPFVVAVPHRDALLACPQQPRDVVEELARRVRSAAKAAPHPISAKLWLVTGPGSFERV
ncbi:MAG TPA: hypothetical protein VJV78_35405 [Polyangiales bacterium]|nr:hypothetical protein [Polyangiales bacterium]